MTTKDVHKKKEQARASYQRHRASRNSKSKAYQKMMTESLAFFWGETPSGELFDEFRASAKINVFQQTREEIAAWALSRSEKLKIEITLFGVAGVLKILRRHPCAGSVETLERQRKSHRILQAAKLNGTKEAAKQFSRIVEMLDAHRVGERLLGDCTKGDLLRAAADAEAAAGEATMNAQFYRLLAGLLPEHGTTVRQANNRKEIVGLLTTTFRESGI